MPITYTTTAKHPLPPLTQAAHHRHRNGLILCQIKQTPKPPIQRLPSQPHVSPKRGISPTTNLPPNTLLKPPPPTTPSSSNIFSTSLHQEETLRPQPPIPHSPHHNEPPRPYTITPPSPNIILHHFSRKD